MFNTMLQLKIIINTINLSKFNMGNSQSNIRPNLNNLIISINIIKLTNHISYKDDKMRKKMKKRLHMKGKLTDCKHKIIT